jgi:hypothetical protein
MLRGEKSPNWIAYGLLNPITIALKTAMITITIPALT